jgi:membrane protease YdiL (CAAX protease family)
MSVLRKPWHTALVIFTIWRIGLVVGNFLQFKSHHTSLDQLYKNQIVFVVLAATIFLTGTITYLKWWPQVAWKSPDNLRDLCLLWLPALLLLSLLMFVLFTGLPPTRIFIFVIINTLMIGISEELMFRGILFHGASSFGTWRAVWITAIIFGASHILNGITTGDFSASTVQAFFACMFGFWTVALRVRLDTIIPGIIIHWVWDFLGFLTNSQGALVMLYFEPVLFFYGLWLLRNYLPTRYQTRYSKANKRRK